MDNPIKLFEMHGPLTGKEIQEKTGMDIFSIWKLCNRCEGIISRTVGERYLRFDKHVDGFARLSPSILREYHGYTVIGLEKQAEEICAKAERIHKAIIEISKKKFKLARDVMAKIVEAQEASDLVLTNVCFILAGDVAYDMANTEPRPECSTGELVNGSDLDIVAVSKDLPDSMAKSLDSSIYEQKIRLLRNPSYREEIDYVIKDISKIESQLKFDSFESMIASKVLYEGKFLYGNFELFTEIKRMITDKGIPVKLAELKEKASNDRENAERKILAQKNAIFDEEAMKLFHTTDEKEEFF